MPTESLHEVGLEAVRRNWGWYLVLGLILVVMGAVARNRWKRLFIGATAERTLEHLPCDLVIVKPDWFQTPVELTAHEAA